MKTEKEIRERIKKIRSFGADAFDNIEYGLSDKAEAWIKALEWVLEE